MSYASLSPISFIYKQFSAKIWPNNRLGPASSLWKILNPPLFSGTIFNLLDAYFIGIDFQSSKAYFSSYKSVKQTFTFKGIKKWANDALVAEMSVEMQ